MILKNTVNFVRGHPVDQLFFEGITNYIGNKIAEHSKVIERSS